MTLGAMAVLERGVGLDKTVHRLPALLVDDFSEVTPELLRTAYVEALYRADDFEFERLTQSYWHKLLRKVSREKSLQPFLDKFPAHADVDPSFTRPLIPYDYQGTCGLDGSLCGKGTKRTPRSSC